VVVDTRRDHIDIRRGIGGEVGDANARKPRSHERIAVTDPPNIVVFYRSAPIRREAVLKANADRPTPTCLTCLGQSDARKRVVKIILLVGDRGAALHIKQGCIPRVANLTREETQAIAASVADVPSRFQGELAVRCCPVASWDTPQSTLL
jgi:hypothetical protein